MKPTLVFLGVLLAVLPGCTRHVLDFTALSTKSANLPNAKGTPVQVETCAERLFVVIPLSGTMRPDLKEAVDRALEQGKGNILIDGVVSSSISGLPPIFYEHCYTVEGTVVTLK
jgi:hypothetical protein